MELTTSWKEEGIQIGLQQGRQEGECAIVLRQLTRRLGRIPVATRKRIERLSVPQLESLGEALLDFAQPADLTAWLRQQQSGR
jgi:predicted transposase YdaD